MKPLLISSGEPAGVGLDLCLALARYDVPVVILGDKSLLEQRARELKQAVRLIDYTSADCISFAPNQLVVHHVACPVPVKTGVLNPAHGAYVVALLKESAQLCAENKFSGLVTAPVHKANINKAGIAFTGHTEFYAEYFKVPQVVMMLACKQMRVALVTTHLPLSQVAASITQQLVTQVIKQLHESLRADFGIQHPRIKVAGLNPHAGESGYLGREEIDIIAPALKQLRLAGLDVEGPFPADTLFVHDTTSCDAYVAMYHDQGLPVLKFAGFNQSVNITLGLPIVRTSVDHGTALELAGTHKVDYGSMIAAVQIAQLMVENRGH
jgi:4-hydroxythreonine-4-phosphate dehydrogenase